MRKVTKRTTKAPRRWRAFSASGATPTARARRPGRNEAQALARKRARGGGRIDRQDAGCAARDRSEIGEVRELGRVDDPAGAQLAIGFDRLGEHGEEVVAGAVPH